MSEESFKGWVESPKNEQYSHDKIRDIAVGHHGVYPFTSPEAKPDSIEKTKKDFQRLQKNMEEFKDKIGVDQLRESSVKVAMKTFRANYNDIGKKFMDYKKKGMSGIELMISTLDVEFSNLSLLILRYEMRKTALKFGINLSPEEINGVNLKEYGHLEWTIDPKTGKMARGVYDEWIGKELKKPAVGFGKIEEKKKNEVMEYAYRDSVQKLNAFYLGIVKSRAEIDELEANKAQVNKEGLEELAELKAQRNKS